MENYSIKAKCGITVNVIPKDSEITIELPELQSGAWFFRPLTNKDISAKTRSSLLAQQKEAEWRGINIINHFKENAIEEMFQGHLSNVFYKFKGNKLKERTLAEMGSMIATIIDRYVEAGNLVEKF